MPLTHNFLPRACIYMVVLLITLAIYAFMYVRSRERLLRFKWYIDIHHEYHVPHFRARDREHLTQLPPSCARLVETALMVTACACSAAPIFVLFRFYNTPGDRRYFIFNALLFIYHVGNRRVRIPRCTSGSTKRRTLTVIQKKKIIILFFCYVYFPQ